MPVLRNVEHLSILEIALALDGLIDRARRQVLSTSDLAGGSFTITNFGSYGITYNLFGMACIVAALGALAIGAKGGLRPQRPPLVTSGAQA